MSIAARARSPLPPSFPPIQVSLLPQPRSGGQEERPSRKLSMSASSTADPGMYACGHVVVSAATAAVTAAAAAAAAAPNENLPTHTIETIYTPSKGWRIDSTYLVHQSSARVYQHGAVASVCQTGRHTGRHTGGHTST